MKGAAEPLFTKAAHWETWMAFYYYHPSVLLFRLNLLLEKSNLDFSKY